MVSTEWSQLLYHKEEDKTASMIKHNAMKSLVATKAENAYQKPQTNLSFVKQNKISTFTLLLRPNILNHLQSTRQTLEPLG